MFFNEVPGQEEVKGHLLEEVYANRLSHAQLFVGQSGFGGLGLAHALAAYVMCEHKGDEEPCGECASCKQLAKFSHPDVHYSFPTVQSENKVSDPQLEKWREINKKHSFFDINDWAKLIDEKNRQPIIGVKESDNIIKKLSLKAYQGKYKIMIIWMADAMNTATANKMLKIIEEPPDHTLFFLIAESMDAILPTILSRTQIVKVPPIEGHHIEKFLLEKEQLDFKEAGLITKLADGNLNEVLKMAHSPGEKSQLHQLFVEWMRMCYGKNVPAMISFANEIGSTSKEQQQTLLKYTLHVLRQAIVGNYNEELRLVTPDETKFLDNFAQFITGNNILQFLETFSKADYHISRNANAKITFLNLSFNVMRYLRKG